MLCNKMRCMFYHVYLHVVVRVILDMCGSSKILVNVKIMDEHLFSDCAILSILAYNILLPQNC
jgi:hypothetical protein